MFNSELPLLNTIIKYLVCKCSFKLPRWVPASNSRHIILEYKATSRPFPAPSATIYSPDLHPWNVNDRSDVLVFVYYHGGGFMFGGVDIEDAFLHANFQADVRYRRIPNYS